MKYGVAMFPTDYAIPADALARELEARGFESLWLPEHTHIPTSRKSPWPGSADLPRDYWHTLDPFVALGAAAAVTKTLMLGTGICLVIERDPIILAKEVASLDFISGGRVLFGIGGGWNAEEMEDHGTPFGERWKILRERISAMKAIWTQEDSGRIPSPSRSPIRPSSWGAAARTRASAPRSSTGTGCPSSGAIPWMRPSLTCASARKRPVATLPPCRSRSSECGPTRASSPHGATWEWRVWSSSSPPPSPAPCCRCSISTRRWRGRWARPPSP